MKEYPDALRSAHKLMHTRNVIEKAGLLKTAAASIKMKNDRNYPNNIQAGRTNYVHLISAL